MDKITFRKLGIKNRSQIVGNLKIQKDSMIIDNILSCKEVFLAKTILLYLHIASEVDVDRIKNNLPDKTVCYPCCIDSENFFAVKSSTNLSKDWYNIPCPKFDKDKIVPPTDIDVAIIPATAYDKQGNRIGMGKGMYDRFLSLANNIIKIGVCYDCQLFDCLPSSNWDIKVNIIVTETKIIYVD